MVARFDDLIHYFTFPTLLRALTILDDKNKGIIAEYITCDFALLYERMIRYVSNGRIPYSLLEGAFRSFGARFAQSVLSHLDFTSDEEPFVVGNLIKAQKKAQIKVFKFEYLQSYYLYKKVGALRKKDIAEITKAIQELDEEKTRSILADRFTVFKKNTLKQATADEVGSSYVTTLVEQQLKNFCKQLSLFEDGE